MFKNLIPRKKKEEEKELSLYQDFKHPFMELHKNMNRIFDDFFEELDPALKSPLKVIEKDRWFKTPQLDVIEKENEFLVEANLPGLDEKDIQINLEGNRLTIKGEKCEEKEDKQGRYYLAERYHGSFSRIIPIPQDIIDQDKIKATFKKGVLKLVLPKIPNKEAPKKQIQIKVEN